MQNMKNQSEKNRMQILINNNINNNISIGNIYFIYIFLFLFKVITT